MHKSSPKFTFLLMTTLIMLLLPFANTTLFSNPAMAQGYDANYDDNSYSSYPTDDKKYECRTGPFEGFFVSSVEFCDAKKFDDNKKRDHRDNRDNKTGPAGPQGPEGPQAGGTGNLNLTVPVVIDVDVATLLQAQLGLSLGIGANATIFEICAAIDAGGLDIDAVLTALGITLSPIVTAQISQLINQIAITVSDRIGEPINQALIDEILASIDINEIVDQITANVQVSLKIFETCLDLTPIPPPLTETLTVIKNTDCLADSQTCANNPIQPSNFTIVIDGNNPSQNNFPGSSGTGTKVELEPGAYNVTEQGLDPVIPAICNTMGFEAGSTLDEDLFICTNFSANCEGDITIGNPQTCTIENVLLVEPNFLDLAVANLNSDNVSILIGNGNGTFVDTPAVNFGAGDGPISVAVGDFNNDTIQ